MDGLSDDPATEMLRIAKSLRENAEQSRSYAANLDDRAAAYNRQAVEADEAAGRYEAAAALLKEAT